jgi:serine/threonine protein phosphatase PrpC
MLVCVKTEKGPARRMNEDSYLVIDDKARDRHDTATKRTLVAVADGMGGQSGGGMASKMACEALSELYRQELSTQELSNPNGEIKLLDKIIYSIHNRIQRYGEENKEYAHMGTILSVLVLLNNLALIAHVGDSRIYRLRHGILEQLTEDHTMAQLSVEMGYLKLQDASKHPLRHMLTQALGEGVDEIQTRKEKVEAGDIFLLCTDGLYGYLSNDEIGKILLSEVVDHRVCARLVEAALSRDAQDDATVIVVQV